MTDRFYNTNTVADRLGIDTHTVLSRAAARGIAAPAVVEVISGRQFPLWDEAAMAEIGKSAKNT